MGGFEQAAAIVRGEGYGLAVAGHGRCLDEFAVGGVGPAVAIGLEVGEERPQGSQLPSYRAIGHACGCQPLTPLADMLGADGGQVLEGIGLDAAGGQVEMIV